MIKVKKNISNPVIKPHCYIKYGNAIEELPFNTILFI